MLLWRVSRLLAKDEGSSKRYVHMYMYVCKTSGGREVACLRDDSFAGGMFSVGCDLSASWVVHLKGERTGAAYCSCCSLQPAREHRSIARVDWEQDVIKCIESANKYIHTSSSNHMHCMWSTGSINTRSKRVGLRLRNISRFFYQVISLHREFGILYQGPLAPGYLMELCRTRQ